MSAIPRKKAFSWKTTLSRVKDRIGHFFNRLFRWRFLSSGVVICLLFLSGWLLYRAPQSVTLGGTYEGCIAASDLGYWRSQPMWRVILHAPRSLIQEHPCLTQLSIKWVPWGRIELVAQAKVPVLAVVVQSVDVTDTTDWQSVFSLPRQESVVWYVAEDGSVNHTNTGTALPRITFLRSTDHAMLEGSQVVRLVKLLQTMESLEGVVPKVEYASSGIVRVSSVTFSALLLSLNDQWEIQLRKAIAVQNYLRLRGVQSALIDAHLRDVVHTAR